MAKPIGLHFSEFTMFPDLTNAKATKIRPNFNIQSSLQYVMLSFFLC